jgi:hypothetical protein
MPEESHPITNAVLAERLDNVLKTVEGGFRKTDESFVGVHERQDTTNGKVIKANNDITMLAARFEYNRIIWYMLTVCVSVIITLVSYILFKRPTP